MSRVLLLCEYPTLHGGERSLLAALPRLAAKGWDFVALAPDRGALAAELIKLGIAIIPFTTHDALQGKLSQPELREQIAAAIALTQPDLVHANSLSMGRLAGPVVSRLGQRSLAHLRDIVRLSEQAIDDLNHHTRLLAVSSATRIYHLAQGLRPEKTFVAYNGVDLDQFCPRPATGWLHDQLQLPRDALLVGAIGQLIARKGHDVLLQAAALVADRFPPAHWVLAGECCSTKDEARQFEAQLRTAALSAPLAGRVHFLGVCAAVPRLLAELSLVAHPARQEPLGRVLLEAAAAGVPIVASDVGGTCEILSPQSAELVPPNDPAALAAAMARLLESESLRAARAGAALATVREHFAAPDAADRLARHYREVLAAAPAAPRA